MYRYKYHLYFITILLSISILFLVPYADAMTARILLAVIFLSPLLAIIITKDTNNSKVIILYCLWTNGLIYIARVLNISLMNLSSQSLSETGHYANLYLLSGHLNFNVMLGHASFILTPFIKYLAIIFCNINLLFVDKLWEIILFVFNVLVASYFAIYFVDTKKINYTFVMLIVWGLVTVQYMFDPAEYRAIGIPLFLMLMLLSEQKSRIEYVVLSVFLVFACSIASPISLLLCVTVFLIKSLIGLEMPSFIFIIPLTRFLFNAYVYFQGYKTYWDFTNYGLINFMNQLFQNEITQRISPLGRVYLNGRIDQIIITIAYLSFILLIFFYLLTWCYLRIMKWKSDEKTEMSIIINILFWTILWITIYLGSSVLSEVSFSDIRVIPAGFIALLLPFGMLLGSWHKWIEKNKIIYGLLIILVSISYMRNIFEVYPITVNDPINVVEDVRLAHMQQYSAVKFFMNHSSNNRILLTDYKMGSFGLEAIERPMQLGSIEKLPVTKVYDAVFFSDPLYQGSSIYISPDTYSYADQEIVSSEEYYNSGQIVEIQKG